MTVRRQSACLAGRPASGYPGMGGLDGTGVVHMDHREDGNHMKNTGKRIFAAAVFALLASLPFIASAGLSMHSR